MESSGRNKGTCHRHQTGKVKYLQLRSRLTKVFHPLRFIKFCYVGGLTAILYFAGMWISQTLFLLDYIVAVSFAYFFSTLFHYFANRVYTFRVTKDNYLGQFGRYALMWCLNYFITVLVVWISVDKQSLSPYLGICISVIFTSLTGYLMGQFWVFKSKR